MRGRTSRPGRSCPPGCALRRAGRIRPRSSSRCAHPLAAGRAVAVDVPFRLRVPGPVRDRLSRSGAALRLGSFFPVLAWEPGVGWDTDPPTRLLAETSSTPTADFDVHVTVPSGDDVLTSGTPVGPGRFTATAVRDFAIAVGRFDTFTVTAHAPSPVRITGAVERGVPGSAEDVVGRARSALEALAARFGPYPWPSLNLAVVPDLGRVGIEYPTMIFLGENGIARATTHEVAHQWFYSLVGNDQARDPVLDEGLATYSQAELDRIWPYLDGLPDPRAAAAADRPADVVLGDAPVHAVPARRLRQRRPDAAGARASGRGHVRTAPVRRSERLRDRHPGRSGACTDGRRSGRAALLAAYGVPSG